MRVRDPFRRLGFHHLQAQGKTQGLIRVFNPEFATVEILADGEAIPCNASGNGCFEALFSDRLEFFPYRIRGTLRSGPILDYVDPYSFSPVLSDHDLHQMALGTHSRLWKKLGANVLTHQDSAGVHFAVWAPGAVGVCVTGDFNLWNPLSHPLKRLAQSDVWELFVPDAAPGSAYRFRIHSSQGSILEKADPMARVFSADAEDTALVLDDMPDEWTDGAWMQARPQVPPALFSIYRLPPGLWTRTAEGGKARSFQELAASLIPRILDLGHSHVLIGPIQQPAPGAAERDVSGFYAPNSRMGGAAGLKRFIEACHQAGLGVLLDWVGTRFPSHPSGLHQFDGTSLYTYGEPSRDGHPSRQFHPFDVEKKTVANFLSANALYWMVEYHFDGIYLGNLSAMLSLDYGRTQGEWVPNPDGSNVHYRALDVLKRILRSLRLHHPGCLLLAKAEPQLPVQTSSALKSDGTMPVLLNRALTRSLMAFLREDPVFRLHHHDKVAVTPDFTPEATCLILPPEPGESGADLLHSLPGDSWQKQANYRLMMAYMASLPGSKLQVAGLEQAHGLQFPLPEPDTGSAGLYRLHKALAALFRSEPALQALDSVLLPLDFASGDKNLLAFRRLGGGREIIVVFNFSPIPHSGYIVGAGRKGEYREILNTDSALFGGSNLGNQGRVRSQPKPMGEMPYSLSVFAPPLAACWFLGTEKGD